MNDKPRSIVIHSSFYSVHLYIRLSNAGSALHQTSFNRSSGLGNVTPNYLISTSQSVLVANPIRFVKPVHPHPAFLPVLVDSPSFRASSLCYNLFQLLYRKPVCHQDIAIFLISFNSPLGLAGDCFLRPRLCCVSLLFSPLQPYYTSSL